MKLVQHYINNVTYITETLKTITIDILVLIFYYVNRVQRFVFLNC